MPRVNLNASQRECRKFSDYVRGQLARTKTRQVDLADYVGITQQGLSKRISGKIDWRLPEMIDVLTYFEESYTLGGSK